MTDNLNHLISDETAMERALALARRGSGLVSPNPMVGAVVVKDGRVVGWGWHRRVGEVHAEVEALQMAGERARGATIFVTLEPCNHFGRTPPCTEALIEAGIARAVIALEDPNLRVKGGGIERLRSAGVEVELGLLSERAYELNSGWIHWIRTGRPFVALKLAVSLDGKISTPSGDSNWISSEVARAQVQRVRRHVDAVLIGSGTALTDNPHLTNRTGSGYQPLRVVVDSELRVGPTANVYRALSLDQPGPSPIAIAVATTRASFQRRRELELAGIEVAVLEGSDKHVDLDAMFEMLGKRGIQSVLCEGGARLGTSLLTRGLCHRLMLYQCPIIIGPGGQSFYEGRDILSITDALRYQLLWSRRVGPDCLSLYRVGEGEMVAA